MAASSSRGAHDRLHNGQKQLVSIGDIFQALKLIKLPLHVRNRFGCLCMLGCQLKCKVGAASWMPCSHDMHRTLERIPQHRLGNRTSYFWGLMAWKEQLPMPSTASRSFAICTIFAVMVWSHSSPKNTGYACTTLSTGKEGCLESMIALMQQAVQVLTVQAQAAFKHMQNHLQPVHLQECNEMRPALTCMFVEGAHLEAQQRQCVQLVCRVPGHHPAVLLKMVPQLQPALGVGGVAAVHV